LKQINQRLAIVRLASAMLAAPAPALATAPAAGATPAGQVVVAGYDYYGELGNGEGIEEITSLDAPSFWGPTLATQAAGADYNNYVLLANGTVEAAGYNEYGDNGLGSTSIGNYIPKVIPGLTGVSEVAAGYDYFGLALLSGGTVDGWGYGYYGELGNGKNEGAAEENSPTPIAGLEHVTQVVAGCYYSMALLSNGTVEAWGWNGYGELGDGTTTETTTPHEVPGLTNVVAIASGCYTSYALLANGKVMAWGYGRYGQLGNGTNTEKQSTPVEVTGLEGATQISAGYYSGYALLSNGTVEDWGYNTAGELGDGGTTEHTEPELVPGLTGVVKITAASEAAYATLSDGTVDGWGYGYYGELANGKKEEEEGAEEKSPTPIAGLSDVISIAKGDYDYALMAIEGTSATLSASSLSFAGQAVGSQSAAQTITLKNDGPAPLAVAADALSGAGAGSFVKTADTCQGQTIAAGSTCSISVAFRPSATGSQSASLALTTSATSTLPSVTLSGTGTSPAPSTTSASGTAHAARSATVKGGKALIKLACTGPGACKGSLKLVARVAQRRAAKGHGKHGRRRHVRNIVIGTASFSIAAGKRETVRVKLSAKGRSLVRKAGRRGLHVTVKGSDIKTGAVVLKQAGGARKHGRKGKHAKRSALALARALLASPFDG
jgi:alpha-tubulin suppressor-like RCC1 family protein